MEEILDSISYQFSKYANNYNKMNIIQQEVAKYLVSQIKQNFDKLPTSIYDFGCGSGALYKNIDWEIDRFVGIDFAHDMCRLHPKNDNVEIICCDFDRDIPLVNKADIIISSSSLQWSKDLDKLLCNISKLSNNFYISLFTNKTFETLHEIAGIKSPIYDIKTIKDIFNRYFDCRYEVKQYRLYFPTKKELFKYIKQSGISSGKIYLNYTKAKELYLNYNLDYLEFEVIFVVGSACFFSG